MEIYGKGIDKVTCDKVLDLLNRRGEVTTGTVGIELGMSRSTARRYLEYLVESGDAHHDQVYGTVGRPERIYRRQRGMHKPYISDVLVLPLLPFVILMNLIHLIDQNGLNDHIIYVLLPDC